MSSTPARQTFAQPRQAPPGRQTPLYWRLEAARRSAAEDVTKMNVSEINSENVSYRERRSRVEEIVRNNAQNYGIGQNMAEEFAVVVADDVVGLAGLETLIRDETIFNVMIRWIDGEEPKVVLQRIGTDRKERFDFPLARSLSAFREGIIGNKAIRLSGQPVNWTYASPHVTLYLPSHKVRIAANMLHDGRSVIASMRMNQTGQPDLDEIFGMRMIPTLGMYKFLKVMLACRANFLVVGSTGSGKTTLLRALLHSVDYYDCLYVVEDSPELDLDQRGDKHDLILPLVPTKERNMAALVRDSQRYMADRIVIGEALDDSIIDWFTVANVTRGSGLTLHTEEPEAVFRRIKNLCGEKLSEREVYERMAESVDVILFVRHRPGRNPERQIENIWALTHQNAPDGKPLHAEMWGFDQASSCVVWRNTVPEQLQEKFYKVGVRLAQSESDAEFVKLGDREIDPLLRGVTGSPGQSAGGTGESGDIEDPYSQDDAYEDTDDPGPDPNDVVARLFQPETKGRFHKRRT